MVSEALASALAPFVVKHGEEAVAAIVKKLEAPKSRAEQADALVNGERQGDYGTPAQNYRDIALVWTGLLGKKLAAPLTAADAAAMMVGLKLARQMNRHKDDNLVDAHGYLMVLEQIVDEAAK